MKISFFEDGTYATGIDLTYIPEVPEIPGQEEIIEDGIIIQEFIEGTPGVPASGKEDCIFVADVDFNPDIQTITLIKNKGKFSVKIEEKPIRPETPEEKHSRIYKSLILIEFLDGFNLEGEEFSDFEIGEIIMARVFGGNPHAESAFNAKILSMLMSGEQNIELMQKAQQIKDSINMIRNLFSLGNL